MSKSLLVFPTLVEAPFIIVKIGNYTFGNYTRVGPQQGFNTSVKVTYPNFLDSMTVTKINGLVNTYVINMVYGIQKGDDPNLLEKVFSGISGTRKITVSYGDWNSPSFVYKEEEAIVTGITSNTDFSTSQIRYQIKCTSTTLNLKANRYNFPARVAKPSTIIKQLLNNKAYGLTDVFYGMKDTAGVDRMNLILSNDKVVKIEAKRKIDVLDYLNYLVGCMTSVSNVSNKGLKTSRYHLKIVDDFSNELKGPYFQIVEVSVGESVTDIDTYEVDVGFPNEDLVMSFTVNTDNLWSVLYKTSEQLTTSNYVYKLNDDGNIETQYSPNVTTSPFYQYSTQYDTEWWSQVTQFPISATLTIKGLIRPAILMNYVKINAYFYGQKHLSSGLYIITKQVDSISASGYRTTLSLTRIPGVDG